MFFKLRAMYEKADERATFDSLANTLFEFRCQSSTPVLATNGSCNQLASGISELTRSMLNAR